MKLQCLALKITDLGGEKKNQQDKQIMSSCPLRAAKKADNTQLGKAVFLNAILAKENCINTWNSETVGVSYESDH